MDARQGVSFGELHFRAAELGDRRQTARRDHPLARLVRPPTHAHRRRTPRTSPPKMWVDLRPELGSQVRRLSLLWWAQPTLRIDAIR